MNLRNFSSVADRRKALEKELDIDLKNIGAVTQVARVENCIGATHVPLGVAGPLKLCQVSSVKCHDYYIPLATTEGALVASINRGCKAITESGGAIADSHKIGATRGPVFKIKNLKESDKLYRFLKTELGNFQEIAAQTSSHLKLEKLLTQGVGKYRYVRFVFDTQDAMGMNMVTIATEKLVAYIEKKDRCKMSCSCRKF